MAIKLVEIELDKPIEPVTGLTGYSRIWFLVKLHGLPLETAKLPVLADTMNPENIVESISPWISWAVFQHLEEDRILAESGYISANEAPCLVYRRSKAKWPVTVVVPTRDGASQLGGCLNALDQLDYPNFEVLIVDNATRDNSTWNLLESRWKPNYRYIYEPRPGVSWALNRGILEASGDILAFTNDDATPDPLWLLTLVSGLQWPGISLVAGRAYPQELETLSQEYIEYNSGRDRGFEPKIIHLNNFPGKNVDTNRLGGSYNMAAWKAFFREIGGFDPALGRGSLAGSAGDADLHFRTLHAGYTIAYEPKALVRLKHPASFSGWDRHAYLGTSGTFAFFTKHFVQNKSDRLRLLKFAISNYYRAYLRPYLMDLGNPNKEIKKVRLALVKGALAGPRNYFRSIKQLQDVINKHGDLKLKQ
jgi:glycosyltransferase involved in cell wall biosynthesis